MNSQEQPFDALPDISDPSLKLSILNKNTQGTLKDLSSNQVSVTSAGTISYEKVGLTLTSASLSWASITFSTQSYWIKESGTWNFYVKNSNTTWKNGISGASLPFTISATGTGTITQTLKDIRLYSEDKKQNWVTNEYIKGVPDDSLLLQI